MLRRITLLWCAAVGTVVPAVIAPPAMAHREACVGGGRAQTGKSMYYQGSGPAVSDVQFNLRMNPALTLCMSGEMGVAGSISGHCDSASGFGITNWGHDVAWVGVGAVWIFSGDVVGTLAVHTSPGFSECSSGAEDFIVYGSLTIPAE